jgi:mannitol/fructose-specific phosphotransferase system IIA component (Ntr-type)
MESVLQFLILIPNYVLKPGIAVATLKDPVKFNVQWVIRSEQIDVKLLFMLSNKGS